MGGGGGGGPYFWAATIVRLFGFDAGKERKRNALLGFFSSSSPSSSSFSTGFLVGDTSAGVATPVAASSAPDLFGFPFLIFFTFFFWTTQPSFERPFSSRFFFVCRWLYRFFHTCCVGSGINSAAIHQRSDGLPNFTGYSTTPVSKHQTFPYPCHFSL